MNPNSGNSNTSGKLVDESPLLDSTTIYNDSEHLSESSLGVKDADFIAIGLGGTNMLAMLWAIAMGRRAVGVDNRGDPFLGVHWNIREDMYHQLGLIDELMLKRYGADMLPRKSNGSILSLADVFYHPSTKSRDIIPDAVIDGNDKEYHLTGRILNIEYIDDRWKDGLPHRTVTSVPPPGLPSKPDPSKIRTDMKEVLDGPSTWQSGAFYIQLLLRRYLERLENIDLTNGITPRCRLFTQHRIVPGSTGLIKLPCGRVHINIEHITELDHRTTVERIRTPGTSTIDLGIPQLFSIATGVHSPDASRLNFRQNDVLVDHADGQGEKIAQADFIAAQIEVLVDGRLRRRIASEFDAYGNEYWVRQIAVGHEGDPRIAWLIVQIPEYMTFCPIERGVVPRGICEKSKEYFAAYQRLLYDYYIEQAALVLELSVDELKRVGVVYGPKPFSLVERIGSDARVAANGVVAGDSFGNGHFLHSAGAMCGMLGHAWRFYEYWKQRETGVNDEIATRNLADQIRADTEALLEVSAKEFSQAIPINFGKERGRKVAAASGIEEDKRVTVSTKKGRRWNQAPLNPTDWRRIFIKNGSVRSDELPEIDPKHPAMRKGKAKL